MMRGPEINAKLTWLASKSKSNELIFDLKIESIPGNRRRSGSTTFSLSTETFFFCFLLSFASPSHEGKKHGLSAHGFQALSQEKRNSNLNKYSKTNM
jgi:hypothetical protein